MYKAIDVALAIVGAMYDDRPKADKKSQRKRKNTKRKSEEKPHSATDWFATGMRVHEVILSFDAEVARNPEFFDTMIEGLSTATEILESMLDGMEDDT